MKYNVNRNDIFNQYHSFVEERVLSIFSMRGVRSPETDTQKI